MSHPNLLIAGATGFIGFQVLLEALEKGYLVRAAIRSASNSNTLLAHPKIAKYASENKLSFIEVPDILATGAYDDAMKDVNYAIHVASPLPKPFFTDPKSEVVDPTMKSAANILQSALKNPSLRRVVITSSIVGNMPFPLSMTDPVETTAKSRVPNIEASTTDVFPAYCAAKIATLNATDKFLALHKPHFALTNIFPGYVYGRNEVITDAKSLKTGSNGFVLGMILGEHIPFPLLAAAAHPKDVGAVHVMALDDKIKGNQDFGVTTPAAYPETFEIVKRHFPKAVEESIFTPGSVPSQPVKWDSSKTEQIFGMKFRSYEDMVVELASQYLELSGKPLA